MSWLKSLTAAFLGREIGVIPAVIVTEIADDFLSDGVPRQTHHCCQHDSHEPEPERDEIPEDWL